MAVREVRRPFNSFLLTGGSTTYKALGHIRYGKGLEVPCLYKFRALKQAVKKVQENFGEAENSYLKETINVLFHYSSSTLNMGGW